MQIYWQHILGYGGTLFLLALLINEKPPFISEPSVDSAFTDAARCSNRQSYAMGFRR